MKVGDRVLVKDCDARGRSARAGREAEATLLYLPCSEGQHEESVLVAFDDGTEQAKWAWLGESHYHPNDFFHARTVGKRCWWVSPSNVSLLAAAAVTTHSSGGRCTVCNEYNEYQNGPFVCYSHR